MRKIYPPFNKFAGFLLYGLLSIAVITLAQKNELLDSLPCMPKPMTSNPARITIGYVQSLAIPKNIPWEFYDYINVIAYPKDGKYSFSRPDPAVEKQILQPIKELVDNKKAKAKILLSIRNYVDFPGEGDYDEIVKQTTDTITEYELDGVDFEYPGMRGSLCRGGGGGGGPGGPGGPIWDKGKDDANFAKFIGNLKNAMGKIKGKALTLMLTVGSDTINGLDFDNIDFLNIETYHNSIYENLKSFNFQSPPDVPPTISSYPNSPLNAFNTAYKNWAGAIDSKKIIMGVDFGNTLQVVNNNQEIKTKQQVVFTPQPNGALANSKRIDSICPDPNPIDGKLFLYFFPWNTLSTAILDQNQCNSTKDADWVLKSDEGDGSYTPWLYKANGPDFQYISYEDYFSLSKKLDYAYSNQIGGMSIRDISDDDSNNSLINFIQVLRGKGAGSTADGGKAAPATPGSATPSSPANPKGDSMNPGDNNFKSSPKTGAIIGGVFGSLIGLVILGACGFYFYRYRGRPKSASFRSLLKFKGFPNSGNHVISRNPEMTTEPTPNLFAPPTTVIPVASGYVTAMFDFTGKEENDLSFKKGDKIEVLERGDGPNDWWVGRVNGAVGEFPGNYVKET